MICDERADRIRRLRAFAEPIRHAVGVDLDDRRLRTRVVIAEDFNEAAVACGPRVGHDHTEERTLFRTCPTQTDRDHVSLLHGFEARYPRCLFRCAFPCTAEIAECAENLL